MKSKSSKPLKKFPLKIMQRADLARMLPSHGGSIDEMIMADDLHKKLLITDEYRKKVGYIFMDEHGNQTDDPQKSKLENWDDKLDDFELELSPEEIELIRKAGDLALRQERFPRSLASIWKSL